MIENNVMTDDNQQSNDMNIDRGMPMLTTFDNPFNPFTEFDEWFLCDNRNEHNCLAYLDRTTRTSPSFTDRENINEIEDAIDRLIDADFLHIYRKVYFDDFN